MNKKDFALRLPVLYERWLFLKELREGLKEAGINPDTLYPGDIDLLEGNVNFLILNLYEPSYRGYCVNFEKIRAIGCEGEAINWGSLKCSEVIREEKGYVVVVEEAAPEARRLQEYIERWLRIWKWPVLKVKTEW